jgi:uncharacterized protein (TIGR02646 family)
MRYIDLENNTPDEQWLKKSDELTQKLIKLHKKGDLEARNEFIDQHKKHWGEIKDWLLKLSHNKCWYSETFNHNSYFDVDHFRPKKIAKDHTGKCFDGYWWLAFDYKNYRACGNVSNRKKSSWFPLKSGSLRSTYDNQCEESEIYYFLDPTDPYDVTLISFNEEGNVIPSPSIDLDWEKQRVKFTIEKLKLNAHEPLTEARKKIWQQMIIQINTFLEAKNRLNNNNYSVVKERFNSCIKKMQLMIKNDAELSSVARCCVQLYNDQSLLKILSL